MSAKCDRFNLPVSIPRKFILLFNDHLVSSILVPEIFTLYQELESANLNIFASLLHYTLQKFPVRRRKLIFHTVLNVTKVQMGCWSSISALLRLRTYLFSVKDQDLSFALGSVLYLDPVSIFSVEWR